MIKNKTIIRSSNFTPGYEYQENGNTIWKRYMHRNGHTITKTERNISIQQWQCMDKENMVGAMEYYSTKKKKSEILPFATMWMNLEGIITSEINQTEKDKYCKFSLTCVI